MQDRSSPCISVIVPIYNTQSYLARCLDSILIQTFRDFEIICIDDGSTDGSSDILEEYAALDSRIHIVHQSHQSAGIARNTGLAMAQGEYVLFLDSDDFIAPETLDHIYRSAQENKSDIVLFAGCLYDDKTQDIVKSNICLRTPLLPEQTPFSWHDVPNYIFNLSTLSAWCKLYARRFLLENELYFSRQLNSEDVCFVLLSLAVAQRISAVPENLIYHIHRPDSLQYTNYEQPLCFLAEWETLYRELIQRDLYIPLQTVFQKRAVEDIWYQLSHMRTDQARIQILDALDNEPYCSLPLKEIPGIEDDNDSVYYKSFLRLTAAQAQYHSSLNALAAVDQFNKLPQESEADASIKVSVVIPVYNTQAYLDETLASITGQTLKNIEIICIDDGSTDGSLDILNRWAADDDRFIVISQPNMGLSYTRNIGITRARGEYLYFMDSDDLLELDALEQLTAIMDEKQLDSLHFDAETFFENTELEEKFQYSRNMFIHNRSYNDIYDGPTLMRLFCNANEFKAPVWLQIYRLDFIQAHNIRMPIGLIQEDNVFTYTTLLFAQRTSHIQHPYYRRRIRPDSIMTKDTSFQNVYSYYDSFWKMIQIYLAISSDIDEINRAAVLYPITRVLKFAQQCYGELNDEERYSRFGLIEDLPLFNALVGEPGTNKANAQRLNKKVSELTAQLKESNAKRAEWYNKLHDIYKEKDDLNAKLKESNAKRAEWYNKLHDIYKEKDDLTAKFKESNAKQAELSSLLKKAREDKTKINDKLQQTYAEKSEINQKLQQTYAEKSELNKKLQTTYTEKSELNKKLQTTYTEKSELNKKLQATYAEKSERGVQIKAQQEMIEKLNEEIAAIQNSRTYRIGHVFTWPVRKIRAIRNK